jgi:hypothetical protein
MIETIIVVIVKTMFRFWPYRVHLLWISPTIKALVPNLSAFTTLFARGKSWDNMRSSVAPYTESSLTCSVANESVGFPVVEQG